MLAVISWWVLDDYCYFLLCPGWLPFFPYGPWMVTVISQQLKYLHRARTVPGTPSIWAVLGGEFPMIPPIVMVGHPFVEVLGAFETLPSIPRMIWCCF